MAMGLRAMANTCTLWKSWRIDVVLASFLRRGQWKTLEVHDVGGRHVREPHDPPGRWASWVRSLSQPPSPPESPLAKRAREARESAVAEVIREMEADPDSWTNG